MEYNTTLTKLEMPEYGRNILKMVEHLKTIDDRQKRSEQAAAVVKSMEILNPQVHNQENWEQKLWDHLYMISGFDLDIDAPFPCPVKEEFSKSPVPLPMKSSRIKATHYGRNIEKIINLLCDEPDGEVKTAMLKGLAVYMRQQYLIWNKDNVADETIFQDIEKLSDYRLKVPEGLSLERLSNNASFARPGMGVNVGQNTYRKQNNRKNIHKGGRRR